MGIRPEGMRVLLIVFAELVLVFTGAVAYYYWPQRPELPNTSMPQSISNVDGQIAICWPGRVFVAKIGEFDHLLSSYLTIDYLRSDNMFRGRQVLLTADGVSGGPPYSIWVHLPDDVLTGVEELADLKNHPLVSVHEESWITGRRFSEKVSNSNRFIQAYNRLDFPELEQVPARELQSYVRQFICFKAHVDPRTWDGTPDPLSPPSPEDADGLAADILEVARFYNLPVDLLLGIGAMENNFLTAPGDLNNAIWKKDVGRDDIVLQRRRHKALVLNSSMGRWQITRQSLRYAHELFLCDTRDYSKLPFALRPTEQLDMNFLSTHVLTTYAALLLQDLLGYFNGDAFLASGAYNGTKLHPNLQYASGVETVASYARRVIGNTARLEHGTS